MSSSYRPAKARFTLLALVIAGAIAFAQWKGWLPADGAARPDQRGGPVIHSPGKSGSPSASRKSGAWEEMPGCTLVEGRGNDGDSFVVRHDGTDHTLRLYFVDCPEKYRNQHNADRIAEQGRYFGGLTEEETIGIGEAARDFALARLRSAPFTVLTRWEEVFDSGRHYAFVTTAEGDLAEALIAEGLARIHTKGENRPGTRSFAEEKQRLLKLERTAQAAGRGAWAGR